MAKKKTQQAVRKWEAVNGIATRRPAKPGETINLFDAVMELYTIDERLKKERRERLERFKAERQSKKPEDLPDDLKEEIAELCRIITEEK